MPDPQPMTRPQDLAAGDVVSLVHLGLAEPPPVPAPPPEPIPPPDPEPTPEEQANEQVLQDVLAEVGVDKTSGDEEAIDALAKLDPDEVKAVARWLRAKKPKPDDPTR